MTCRFIHSFVVLMMLAMGVVTFDNWGNMLNMPDDDLEEVLDTSLFPARQIRADWCNCNWESEWMDFGRDAHPRYLVSKRCKVGPCGNGLEQCRDVNYTINISLFRNTDSCSDDGGIGEATTCYKYVGSTPKTISAACVPVRNIISRTSMRNRKRAVSS